MAIADGQVAASSSTNPNRSHSLAPRTLQALSRTLTGGKVAPYFFKYTSSASDHTEGVCGAICFLPLRPGLSMAWSTTCTFPSFSEAKREVALIAGQVGFEKFLSANLAWVVQHRPAKTHQSLEAHQLQLEKESRRSGRSSPSPAHLEHPAEALESAAAAAGATLMFCPLAGELPDCKRLFPRMRDSILTSCPSLRLSYPVGGRWVPSDQLARRSYVRYAGSSKNGGHPSRLILRSARASTGSICVEPRASSRHDYSRCRLFQQQSPVRSRGLDGVSPWWVRDIRPWRCLLTQLSRT